MLKNFFRTAWRNMIRHKMHTVINVCGLALGITCCLFIFLWVQDEQSIDNFHHDGKNLYTVYQTIMANGKTNGAYSSPLKYVNGKPDFLMEDIRDAIPEVKHQVFYATGYELPWGHAETFQVGEKMVKLDGSRASADFFKLFNYHIIAGTAETALRDMSGIAISRKMAVMFFKSPEQAIGKSIRYENKFNFAVSAVFEDVPAQSSLKFDFLFNWDAQKRLLDWASNDFQTYIQLSPTANPEQAVAKINQYLQPRFDKGTGVQTTVSLQHFGDQYLYGNFVNGKPDGGRIEYVHIFSEAAIFILIIACINFMNLATARSVKRAREVGVKKVIGSSRTNLICQFFGESLLFSFMAMLVSVVLLIVLLPAFAHFTGKQFVLPFLQASFWVSLLTLTCITGFIAGIYPALYLSSLQPVRILKGVLRFTQSAVWFRKGLTVFQFVLSIILLIATLVISRQTNYVQNTHLGYDRENLIYVRIEGELAKKSNYLLFKERALKMPGVAMIDRSSEAPHAMNFVVTDDINWQGKEKDTSVGFKPASVGFDFIKLMKLKIAYGRDFSPANVTDSTDAFMVNEEAVRQMGLKNPIGQWVSAWKKRGHIIAVLKDYHTQSLHEPIKPVMIDVKEGENFGVILVRTEAGKTKQALESLAATYKDINPDYPFAYQFVDQEYKKLYNSELIITQLSIVFAVVAIIISCLGLLGLVMFSAEQRTKEFGVRKVLGASLPQLTRLFASDFLQLIGIAFLIATPLGWYAMVKWLQSFAYRIDLSWWIFVLAGAISLLIALLTLSYEAVKTAMANPVKSLRAE
ncbi:ABC transporter permease [Mucilaginibacter sp. SP1R1]|uniref:ABC transporter permease n=1 Tax=Mucilaginibacter sp. SP1R1 TaxID=2723091 RepID=UPI00160CD576|nr:ABC transporter permease [Mucilaginibacter sp. SP1R1]MBB6149573.1 ABC-type antimicrobial peptide transport system permease subunit [Mucilaginibacter sp. SP1R1]